MDLISDPVATVEGVYRHFGMTLPDAAATAIERYVDAKAQRRLRPSALRLQGPWPERGDRARTVPALHGPLRHRRRGRVHARPARSSPPRSRSGPNGTVVSARDRSLSLGPGRLSRSRLPSPSPLPLTAPAAPPCLSLTVITGHRPGDQPPRDRRETTQPGPSPNAPVHPSRRSSVNSGA